MPHLPIPQPIDFLPEKLRGQPIYPKITAMLDHILTGSIQEFEDVRLKYAGQDVLRNDVVKEIVSELGFEYVKNVMDTITNFEFNLLLQFIALLNILKGSRQGLDLILQLLGFSTIIKEWWENTPPTSPDTYDLIVVMDTTIVENPALTLNKIQLFAREYVYPVLSNTDFRFSLSFVSKNVNMGGFSKSRYSSVITARL
jgi:hypothetical protein